MPVDVKDHTERIRAAMKALTKTKVLVGIPSDSESKLGVDPGPNARTDTPLTNAEIAYLQSNGMPEHNVPARPFLEPGVAEAQPQINAVLKTGAKNALQGHVELVDQALDAVGLIAQASARNVIRRGIPPPLSDRTVAARRRRTKGSSYRRKAASASDVTPLLDSAQLIHSISYVKRETK